MFAFANFCIAIENDAQTTWNVHGQRKSNPHVPNVSYIPLAHVGARVRSAMLCVGSAMFCVGSMRLFRYQHVGIGNAKYSCWGSSPTRAPNASRFALQWNIGFIILGSVGKPEHNYYFSWPYCEPTGVPACRKMCLSWRHRDLDRDLDRDIFTPVHYNLCARISLHTVQWTLNIVAFSSKGSEGYLRPPLDDKVSCPPGGEKKGQSGGQDFFSSFFDD